MGPQTNCAVRRTRHYDLVIESNTVLQNVTQVRVVINTNDINDYNNSNIKLVTMTSSVTQLVAKKFQYHN